MNEQAVRHLLINETSEDGDKTEILVLEANIYSDEVCLIETIVTTRKGEEVDRERGFIPLPYAAMDRLIELYQQYRKEHEKRAVEN